MSIRAALSRHWLRGAILVSLGAHALMLRFPLPDNAGVSDLSSNASTSDASIDSVAADSVSVIAIEALPLSPSLLSQQNIEDQQIESQQIEPEPPPPSPPAVLDQPIVAAPPAQALPSQPPPLPPEVAPAAPEQQAVNPPEISTPIQTPVPTQPPMPLAPEQGMVISLAEEFPHFAGVQSGCFRLANCHRISGQGSYRQAAKQLVEQMQAQGYQVNQREDIDDQGHRVYEVIMPSEPDTTYYLNVFSDSADSMVYALTLEIVSLTELQQLAG
ncbi:MAG: hypothetical protein AAF703_12140 [Cyanobacteria bacterium P01_D01_bin.105]